ncbi:hypothetical protein AVEN_63981-1 [Araneus ventricosus]|uniref:Uncharacterized protein n=1 Tax=Araneus ventricosus TaxID=182803 RepID=A0A4Y2KV50_ARAVE|nr:hypothetical protein AVEN_101372-1 [Araneus ventricosus]GBN06178.1 hypothetical protein AVEN_21327-1 [Araneus ventricosus]GBN06188.1 hypothetical protein AVEN_61488-1 [Araneus ventricosus]GBN06192.1 hypothetical protein AVEN_63981-1 [Araneus ventricosus]
MHYAYVASLRNRTCKAQCIDGWLTNCKDRYSPSICSNTCGGLLSKPFLYSGHKIWWIIHRSDCANSTYGQPDPLFYCASSPAFKIGLSALISPD